MNEALTKSDFRTLREPGRPSKLTAKVRDRIVEGISRGNYGETVAAGAGVSRRAFQSWLVKAREILAALQKGEMQESDLEEKHYDLLALFYAVETALDGAEARHIGIIDAAAEKSWQAAAWLLERKFPERYAVRRDINVSGQIEHSHKPVMEAWDRHKKLIDARRVKLGIAPEPKNPDQVEFETALAVEGMPPEEIAWQTYKLNLEAKADGNPEIKTVNHDPFPAEPVES